MRQLTLIQIAEMSFLPDAEMVIGDEWRRLVLRGVRGNEGRDVSKNDHGTSNEEEAGPPPEVQR